MAFRPDGFSRSLQWTGHLAGLSRKFLQLFLQFKLGVAAERRVNDLRDLAKEIAMPDRIQSL